jgi:hypothetical protein
MKQTAIEWLVDELILEGINVPKVFYDKAKEMEKEQHGKTWDEGIDEYSKYNTFEQYYKETYESKTNL